MYERFGNNNFFKNLMKSDPVLVDLKGLYQNPENGMTYWRL